MDQLQLRLQEVATLFGNNDVVPAFRKLLDLATDTQNMPIYKEAIALTDWREANPDDTKGLSERSLALLEKIRKIAIPVYENNTPIVVADAIEKSYGNGKFSLGPVSVSIKKGEVYGLVGENGNGKTTLLRILAQDLSFNNGSLSFHFNKGNNKDLYGLRTRLVYIPQRTQKWYGSLKDNLKFVLAEYGTPANENETRVLMMIARLGLWKYRNLKWSELSSGYKMRFELARTLLRKPELLLLDEPLANLDIVAQQVILEDLKSIANSISNPIALILSSQQLYEVEKISDRVIYLRNGKHIETDLPATNETIAEPELIIEIDSSSSREELLQAFEHLNLKQLKFNGGVYIAYFTSQTSFADVLQTLGSKKCKLVYVRDISASTRRLFVS